MWKARIDVSSHVLSTTLDAVHDVSSPLRNTTSVEVIHIFYVYVNFAFFCGPLRFFFSQRHSVEAAGILSCITDLIYSVTLFAFTLLARMERRITFFSSLVKWVRSMWEKIFLAAAIESGAPRRARFHNFRSNFWRPPPPLRPKFHSALCTKNIVFRPISRKDSHPWGARRNELNQPICYGDRLCFPILKIRPYIKS